MSFQHAVDNSDIAMLEGLLCLAKDAVPLLGPDKRPLEQEVAVAEQRYQDVKEAAELARERAERGLPEIDIPDQFMCPITRSKMRDPVTAADGFSYEREAIEEHLKTRNTSPKTNEQMQNKVLHPNLALKQLIRVHEANVQGLLKAVQEQERLSQKLSEPEHQRKEEPLHREHERMAERRMRHLQWTSWGIGAAVITSFALASSLLRRR
mmetsp:Transcript_52276/g.96282  ORF Transcript_52276/g.96282 Transcript_52276/m.96282 type:complete len:209 (+) Transcript_52276:1-627(+)